MTLLYMPIMPQTRHHPQPRTTDTDTRRIVWLWLWLWCYEGTTSNAICTVGSVLNYELDNNVSCQLPEDKSFVFII